MGLQLDFSITDVVRLRQCLWNGEAYVQYRNRSKTFLQVYAVERIAFCHVPDEFQNEWPIQRTVPLKHRRRADFGSYGSCHPEEVRFEKLAKSVGD